MTRLAAPPSTLAPAPSRIGRPPVQSQGPVRHREAAPWRGWYKLARWRELRREVLVRDAFTCQWPGCGRICTGRYPADDSPVVDHRRPHRGDAALFWDRTNLQTLCKSPCHDRHKQALEQGSRHHLGVWD